MTVCVTLEHRFERTPDGAVWTHTNHEYAELKCYLEVFDHVRILARVLDVEVAPSAALRADGEGVSFFALPYYRGLGQFCRCRRQVRRAALRAIGAGDAVILKAPSPISQLIEPALTKQHRPFGVQLLSDPWALYARGSVRHLLRPLFRFWFTWRTASLCRQAAAVSYVTSRTLPARYPAGRNAFQVAVSDVDLPAAAFASQSRRFVSPLRPLRVITVGSLEHPYKGTDVLIEALRLCAERGVASRLIVVGDGKFRRELESLAREKGVEADFRGMLPAGARVIAALDEADLFVLPSRVEGLPRVLLEAMARALPCIGSAVGGIPELLDEEDLVPSGDAADLAARIAEVAGSPVRMEQMSERCLRRAQAFRPERLEARRKDFLASIRNATEAWNRGTSENTQKAPLVLQVLTRLGAGGAPIVVIELDRVLRRLGYRTLLVTGTCDHADLDMSYLLTPDDPVEWVPEMSRLVSPKNDLIALWRLYRIMRRTKPLIVQTHTSKAGALGRVAARLARVPVVVHTYHGHVLSECFSERASQLIRFVERMLAKVTDAICVLAPQQAHDLVEKFHVASQSQVHVLPLGLDLKPFQQLSPPRPDDNWLTVGWLGRLAPVKNIPLLIKVMEEVFSRNDRIRFIVAGDGEQRPLLEAAARNWDKRRFEWLGWVHDVTGIVSRCDLLIQTSRNEGTPIALIQGMAAGRPFLSTPAGGVVDMVAGPVFREGGGARWYSNAVLVDANSTAFATVLCELQKNPRLLEGMDREAAQLAAARYNLGLLARNYDRLYSQLIEDKLGVARAARSRVEPPATATEDMRTRVRSAKRGTGPNYRKGREIRSSPLLADPRRKM